MIYKETYDYLLHHVSGTGFDTCLYALLKTDWDGRVQADLSDIARNVQSTRRYVSSILSSFTEKDGRRQAMARTYDKGEVRYQWMLGRNAWEYRPSDTYCKKYHFFYTSAFRSLPLNAKRLVLMAAFKMSVEKQETVHLPVSSILPNCKHAGVSGFTRGRLHEAIESLRQSDMDSYLSLALQSNLYTKEEVVAVSFAEGTLDAYKENYTERFLLRKMLIQHGHHQFVSDDTCSEIEKTAKGFFRGLLTEEEQFSKETDFQEERRKELLHTARHLYQEAVASLAKALTAEKKELSSPKEISAYFSAVLHHLAEKEMGLYGYQAVKIQTLCQEVSVSNHAFTKDKSIWARVKQKRGIAESFKRWCEKWVYARLYPSTKEERTAPDLSHLLERSTENMESMMDWVRTTLQEPEAATSEYLFYSPYLETIQQHIHQAMRRWSIVS